MATTKRNRMFALVSALEEDVNSILGNYVAGELTEAELYKNTDSEKMKELRRRRDLEEVGDYEEVSEVGTDLYLYDDLQPKFDLINIHKELIPHGLAKEVKGLATSFNQIVRVRNKLVHTRPLEEGAEQSLVSALYQFQNPSWARLRSELKKVVADKNYDPGGFKVDEFSDACLNNLPIPEYDETGFIGRDKEVSQLAKKIVNGRYSVITIIGEGGKGKTALAREVLDRIQFDPKNEFEVILWVSLKKEQLTAEGVQSIYGALTEIYEIADYLGGAVLQDESFEGGLEALSTLLEGTRTLICIDNIETIDGDMFVEMYDTLPRETQYLLTSRHGIGQLEHLFRLADFGENSAKHLFRKFASEWALGDFSEQQVASIVSAVSFNPLGVKFVAMALESGCSYEEVLKSGQEELYNFCFESVYAKLSVESKKVISVLNASEVSIGLSSVCYLSGLTADEVFSCFKELERTSLLQHKNEGEIRLYELNPSMRSYLSFVDLTEIEERFLVEVKGQLEDHKVDRVRHEQDVETMPFHPLAVIVPDESCSQSAAIIRSELKKTSMRSSISEVIDGSLEILQELKKLEETYFEIHRAEGFLLDRKNDYPNARAAYEKALKYADSEKSKAVVKYFLSKLIGKNPESLDCLKLSLEYAKDANRVYGTFESVHNLGRSHLFLKDFESANECFAVAKDKAAGSQKKYLIAVTSIADCWHRLGEKYAACYDLKKSYESYFNGVSVAYSVSSSTQYSDAKCVKILIKNLNGLLGALFLISDQGVEIDLNSYFLLDVCDLLSRHRESVYHKKGFEYLGNKLNAFSRFENDSTKSISWDLAEEMRLTLDSSLSNPRRGNSGAEAVPDEDSLVWHSGLVLFYKPENQYGFISSGLFPNNVFFSAQHVVQLGSNTINKGMSVKFVIAAHDPPKGSALPAKYVVLDGI